VSNKTVAKFRGKFRVTAEALLLQTTLSDAQSTISNQWKKIRTICTGRKSTVSSTATVLLQGIKDTN